ncbi:class I SAM-dependent methyltransferase [Antribacter gilvus]|uniref:class I SAM-dependent methyltransferase n=1 Tax=Antribacter gilvus TaxID=2304675 RepID=UPI000F785949|nr:methyltransferase domain-containing protein [Antribacter gilvus]
MTAVPSAREPGPVNPLVLFEAALAGLPVLAVHSSRSHPVDVAAWTAEQDPVDEAVLARCEPPVLDVGCGPGRFAAALAARGVPALGIDVSRAAVRQARARGAVALRRPVEGPLPGEGRWGTVLLADGNIGIGGSPQSLLARSRGLARPGGLLVVEADADPEADESGPLVLHAADGRRSHPMPWARAGSRVLRRLATREGLTVTEEWTLGGRTLLCLRAPL